MTVSDSCGKVYGAKVVSDTLFHLFSASSCRVLRRDGGSKGGSEGDSRGRKGGFKRV